MSVRVSIIATVSQRRSRQTGSKVKQSQTAPKKGIKEQER